METFQFDISQYLPDSKMKEIAEKVFEEHIKISVDDILKNRILGYGGIVEQILEATSGRYVDKLSSSFEEDFLRVCKEEINTPKGVKDEDCNQTFRNGLVYKLLSAADKYIDSNLEIIQTEMKDSIMETARNMVDENFRSRISSKIDFRIILRDVLSEIIDNEKKSIK
jgi:hypothetical protein